LAWRSATSHSVHDSPSTNRTRDRMLTECAIDEGCTNPPPPSHGACRLACLWEDLVRGRRYVRLVMEETDRVVVVASNTTTARPLPEADAAILSHVFCGIQQKRMAFDFGIAASTVSVHCHKSMTSLGISSRRVPLPVLLAAQSHAGVIAWPPVQTVNLDPSVGAMCVALGVRRPVMSR